MRTTDSRHDTTADTRPQSTRCGGSLDAAFDALADQRCRVLLGHLADSDDDQFGVVELAAHLADAIDGRTERRENEAGVDQSADEGRFRSVLHHNVLPRLADAGLLNYDSDRGLVQYRSDSLFEAVRPVVESYEADEAVALDDLFDQLAAFRRRAAYRTLLRHGSLTLPDLADEVAVTERDKPLPEIDADAVLKVYLSLYHTHVPKLAATGLVTYEQETDSVTLTETGRAVESPVWDLLDAVDA